MTIKMINNNFIKRNQKMGTDSITVITAILNSEEKRDLFIGTFKSQSWKPTESLKAILKLTHGQTVQVDGLPYSPKIIIQVIAKNSESL